MATFLVLYTELGDRLNLDSTVAAQATRVKRWLNLAQADICSRRDWKWLQERAIIQTVIQKTAGTVDLTNASGAVAGTTTAFASTDKRSFFTFQGSDDIYELTTFTSSTSVTVTPTFGGTTATAQTYILTKIFYSLGATVERILDIRQFRTPTKLVNLGYRTLDSYLPDIVTTGPPIAYTVFRLDPEIGATAAKQVQISLYPISDAVYNLEVRFKKILADLSADGDISDIPAPFHNVILSGAEWMGSKFVNDPKEMQLKQIYEADLRRMEEEDSATYDYQPVLRGDGDQQGSKYLLFPAQFEQP